MDTTRERVIGQWSFAVGLVLLSSLSGAVQAQSKAEEALRRIDAKQCDAAVELINQGMLAGEPMSFYVAGQLFQQGFCLVQNVPRAIRHYERGALLGDRTCARALAIVHARGDGVPQSYPEAGRWYAIANGTNKDGVAEKAAGAYGAPDAVVGTYIEAVNDVAVAMMVYPRDAIDRGVTGSVKVRFDPRFGQVRLLGSKDSDAPGSSTGPMRHDFERALQAGYADAIRVLPRPAMSLTVDNAVEHEVIFDRKPQPADQPVGLQALAR